MQLHMFFLWTRALRFLWTRHKCAIKCSRNKPMSILNGESPEFSCWIRFMCVYLVRHKNFDPGKAIVYGDCFKRAPNKAHTQCAQGTQSVELLMCLIAEQISDTTDCAYRFSVFTFPARYMAFLGTKTCVFRFHGPMSTGNRYNH